MLKVGTPLKLVMVFEGLELYAVLGLKGNSVICVVIALEKPTFDVCSQEKMISLKRL